MSSTVAALNLMSWFLHLQLRGNLKTKTKTKTPNTVSISVASYLEDKRGHWNNSNAIARALPAGHCATEERRFLFICCRRSISPAGAVRKPGEVPEQ